MTSKTWLKTASAALLAAMLAACGGGGTTSTPLPDVAWASPAVFVTPGAANKSFELTMCERDIEEGEDDDEHPLYKASLQIASNGDVSVVASTTETATATAVWSMAFADAQNTSWSVSGNTQTPTYSLNMYSGGGRSGYKSLNVYRAQISETEFAYHVRTYVSDNNANTYIEIDCLLTGKLELQVNADQARAAKNLGTAAGVTTFDDYNIDGRIEGGNAFWQQSNYESPGDKYNFMRFNLGTGELSSSNANTGTYAAISLSLPSGTSSYGVYGETVSRNNSFFDYKEAKSICLGFESMEAGFSLSATAYGNKFYPSSRFFGPRGLETPQGPGGGVGCGFDG